MLNLCNATKDVFFNKKKCVSFRQNGFVLNVEKNTFDMTMKVGTVNVETVKARSSGHQVECLQMIVIGRIF